MLKKLWFQLHWLLGITAGLILAVMGVTGAALSYENELLRALNPGVMTVASPPNAARLSPPELIAGIAESNPDRRIGSVSVSSQTERAARIGFVAKGKPGEVRKPGARPRMDVHFADPYTGCLLGREDDLTGHAVLHFLEDVHRRLAGGDTGKALTGESTLILLVLAGSGVYLRWLRHPLRWRKWLLIGWHYKGSAFLRSLHEVVAIWALPLYLVAALTGLFWSYDWYRDGVFAVMGATPPTRQPPPSADKPPLPMSQLSATWEIFQRETAATGYSSASFNLPVAGEPLTINYVDSDPAHERASNRIVLDPAGAAVKNHERYADKTAGGKLAASMFALHRGSFFGSAGILLMMLASLAMPLFAITGWMLYLDRRRVRRTSGEVAASIQTAGN